jgi:hypothetical protein
VAISKRRPMDPSERIAQHVFKTVHKGTEVEFRSQQSTGEDVYDFDVTYPDGRKAALEVTRSTHQESIVTLEHLRQRSYVDAKACQHSWVVSPHPDCRIDLIRKNVDRYLSQIESRG